MQRGVAVTAYRSESDANARLAGGPVNRLERGGLADVSTDADNEDRTRAGLLRKFEKRRSYSHRDSLQLADVQRLECREDDAGKC